MVENHEKKSSKRKSTLSAIESYQKGFDLYYEIIISTKR